jgi:hypothetical protein
MKKSHFEEKMFLPILFSLKKLWLLERLPAEICWSDV